MIGFEVTLNGKGATGAIEKGVLTVILTNKNSGEGDVAYLDLGGLVVDDGTYVTWLHDDKIKAGDEIVIKVKNVEKASTPIESRSRDQVFATKDRVQAYYDLKAALEKDGLI